MSSHSQTSLPSVVHVFQSGIRTPPASSLDELIRHQLEAAAREVAVAAASDDAQRRDRESKTLVTDMGEYLTQAARVWSRLTENLVQGAHMDAAAIDAHERSLKQSRVADLSAVVTMDIERSKLCKIQKLTEQFSRDVQDIWRPKSPIMEASTPPQQTAFSPFRNGAQASLVPTPEIDYRRRDSQRSMRNSQISYQHSSPRGIGSGSDDSEDEDEQFSRIDMEALKQRGKGSYYCPMGHRCDKGGVDKDGKLVVFDRNSSFAQHCNKHRKPWRCDVPGCPNPPKKRKFARRDGLERHKATVKHCLVT